MMEDEVIDLGDATPAPPLRYTGTYVDCKTSGRLDYLTFYTGQRGSKSIEMIPEPDYRV